MVADPVKDGLLDSHNGDLEPNLPLEVPKRTSTAEEVRLHATVHVLSTVPAAEVRTLLSTGCRGAYAPQARYKAHAGLLIPVERSTEILVSTLQRCARCLRFTKHLHGLTQ